MGGSNLIQLTKKLLNKGTKLNKKYTKIKIKCIPNKTVEPKILTARQTLNYPPYHTNGPNRKATRKQIN
jgi:hypothetical protein